MHRGFVAVVALSLAACGGGDPEGVAPTAPAPTVPALQGSYSSQSRVLWKIGTAPEFVWYQDAGVWSITTVQPDSSFAILEQLRDGTRSVMNAKLTSATAYEIRSWREFTMAQYFGLVLEQLELRLAQDFGGSFRCPRPATSATLPGLWGTGGFTFAWAYAGVCASATRTVPVEVRIDGGASRR